MPSVKISKIVLFAVSCIPATELVVRFVRDMLGANPIEELTHQTGLWALRFLLITLAVSPLRKITGYSSLIQYRRMLGLFSFFYALCHFSIYIILDQWFDWRAILEDIMERPYITVGTAALIGLLPLAITSTHGWQVRLQHRWNRLHRLIYLIALLGVIHYWWLVKADVRDPMLYAAILAVLLLYRIGSRYGVRWFMQLKSSFEMH